MSKRTYVYTEEVYIDKTPTSFTVPSNSRINSIISEKIGTDAGNLVIGTSATPAKKETAIIENLTEAIKDGILTVHLQGEEAEVVATVEVTEGMTGEEVAVAIAGTNFTDWTAEADGNSVIFGYVGESLNPTEGAYSFDVGDTGIVTADPSVKTEGVDFVAATMASASITVNAIPSSAGDITIDGVTISLDPAVQTTTVLVAAAIAAGSYEGWTAIQGSDDEESSIFFTPDAAGVIDAIAFVDTGSTAVDLTVTNEAGTDEVSEVAEVIKLPKPTQPTADGYILLTVGNTSITLPVATTDEAATISTSIKDTYNAVATADFVASSDASNILFTAKEAGARETVYSVSYYSGVTADPISSVAGSDWVVGDELVTSVALTTTNRGLEDLSVKKRVFEKDADASIYIGVSGNARTILHFNMEKFA